MKKKRVSLKEFLVVSLSVLALSFGGRLIYDVMGPDCSFVHANHGVAAPKFSAYHVRRCKISDKSAYDSLYW